MKLIASGLSDVGRVREMNEDTWLAAPELGLYVVCDGMGGHAGGEVASRLAAETVVAAVRSRSDLLVDDPTPEQCETLSGLLRHAVEAASAAVYRRSVEEGNRGMGTTCTTLLIAGGKAIMGHVGDSRLYLSRAGQLHQVSQDHTYVNEAVRHGIMTREEALASGYGNIVTRAVGPHENVLVDTLVFDVLPHDRLLLCSDGLHGYFENAVELVTLLRENDTERLTGKLRADVILDHVGGEIFEKSIAAAAWGGGADRPGIADICQRGVPSGCSAASRQGPPRRRASALSRWCSAWRASPRST